jgi:ABC-2 type transport system permease protein
MLGRIALFELRYQLRRPIALISFIVFAALAVGLQSVIALAGGALFVNAPSVIAQQLGIFSIVAMFLSLAVLADVARAPLLRGASVERSVQPTPVTATA